MALGVTSCAVPSLSAVRTKDPFLSQEKVGAGSLTVDDAW